MIAKSPIVDDILRKITDTLSANIFCSWKKCAKYSFLWQKRGSECKENSKALMVSVIYLVFSIVKKIVKDIVLKPPMVLSSNPFLMTMFDAFWIKNYHMFCFSGHFWSQKSTFGWSESDFPPMVTTFSTFFTKIFVSVTKNQKETRITRTV